MAKELNEFLSKFNSMIEAPSSGDYQNLFSHISSETDLSSKIYKVLESLQTKLLKHPSDIESNYDLLKLYLIDQLPIRNKSLFDFIINWLVNLYYKLEENEKLVLNIFFDNILKNNFSKVDLVKKLNIEENYFFKALIKSRPDCYENLQKICYVYDFFEKKAGGGERLKDNFIKVKNKRVLEMMMKYFGRSVLDFYLIMMCYKVKASPNKFDIESEKWNLKNSARFYTDIYNYSFEIFFYCFNPAFPSNMRKLILFVDFIFLKNLGLVFLGQLFQNFLKKLHTSSEIFHMLKSLDFSILNENFTYNYQNIDTTIGFNKTIENILFDMIGTQNLKFEEKDKKQIEINEDKILSKLTTLKYFILFIESFINQILINGVTNFNIVSIYTFYYSLQLKFIKNFVVFPDTHKKRYFENQVDIGNIIKILPKYNKQYENINSIFSEIISLFYNKNGTSLIFQNWLIFLYKNGTILDAYKALRIFLLTKKEGGQIYTLLKMHYEISKFYPSLWRIVLDSFLIDSSNRNSEENYNLITNLKFIFYYEISLKSTKSHLLKSDFYDSISYDCTIILKFFREKFSILTSIFFSDENLLDNILSLTADKVDMDICFETYIKQKTLASGVKSKFSNKPPNHSDSSMLVDSKDEDKVHNRTKIEILNILSFLLNTYNDTEIINHDINKFVLDLFDVFIEKRESGVILDYISNIMKILLKIYKKNLQSSKMVSSPIRMLFINLVKHILNKILISESFTGEETAASSKRAVYYQIFKEIFSHLNKHLNEIEDISNIIIFMIKELIYKNVDNQSFKNPYTLKNMQGLNDIDEKIIEKEYIIDLLDLLEDRDNIPFYGFYLRFITYSIQKMKVNKKPTVNLKKVLSILLKINWLPAHYVKLIEVLDHLPNYRSSEKILLHIYNYLSEFPPMSAEDSKYSRQSDQMQFDDENKIKKKEVFKIQFKNLIFENIKVIH